MRTAAAVRGGLIGGTARSYLGPQEGNANACCARAVLAIAIVTASAAQAAAQAGAKTDPDWPCHQIKTPTFSLASVWAGPQLDLNSQSWRNESDVADLAAKMAQRRVPIADVESAIAEFKAKAGPDADAKLLGAFAAAFEDLSQQRSQIIDGLDRFGRKQRALADRIRAENEAVQKSADQSHDGAGAARRRQSRAAAMGHPRLRRSPSDRQLRLRGADADRTAHRRDRARRAKGSVTRRPRASARAEMGRLRSSFSATAGGRRQGEIGLSFSSSNGTP